MITSKELERGEMQGTLKDLREAYGAINDMLQLFGAHPEVQDVFDRLTEAARAAVMEEHHLSSPTEALYLPQNTILGKKSQAVLKGFRALYPKD